MHEKHAKLPRPQLGTFSRTELAVLGTSCGNIKMLVSVVTKALHSTYRIAYVDADHQGEGTLEQHPMLSVGAELAFTDKISFKRFDTTRPINDFQWKPFFNDSDLVLVNGNHFTAQAQIAIIDPTKPLEKKLDRLTNVQLLVLKDVDQLPDYLKCYLADRLPAIPIVQYTATERIIDFIRQFVREQTPPLLGLVLSGGQSTRMGFDKSTIDYHGRPQRDYLYDQLSTLCDQVFLSVNATQAAELTTNRFLLIEDTFLGLGPLSGILSAFRQRPDAAWLVVACDLPLLTTHSLTRLKEQRNISKLATAFWDSDHRFPEPLISLWEPRAYPVLLQFLAMGQSCPRKVLINSEIELLDIDDVRELVNANDSTIMNNIRQQLAG